jgi:translin
VKLLEANEPITKPLLSYHRNSAMIDNIQNSIDNIHEQLIKIEWRREKLIIGTRKIVLLCGKSIVSMHRHDIEEGEKNLEEARALLDEYRPIAQTDLQKYISDAEQEFVEASMLNSICKGSSLPPRETLNVSGPAYITGILDAIGEIKRLVFDRMRTSKTDEVGRLFDLMQEFHNAVYLLGGYDNLVPGLRRKLDVSKMIIEDVRAVIAEDSRRDAILKAMTLLQTNLMESMK